MLYELYDCDECVNDLVLLFRCEHVTVAGETVARSVTLAQARLAGANQGFHKPSLRQRALVLSEALSCSSESHSPKRRGVKTLGRYCGLAQARDLSFGRGVVSLRRGKARLSEPARTPSTCRDLT